MLARQPTEAIRRAAAVTRTTVLNEDSTWETHGRFGMSMEKTRRHLRRQAQIHQGVGHASMAEEIPFVARSMEHEGMVDKLRRSSSFAFIISWNGSIP